MIWSILKSSDLLLTASILSMITTSFKPLKMEILTLKKLRSLFKKSRWPRSTKSNNKLHKQKRQKSPPKKKKPLNKQLLMPQREKRTKKLWLLHLVVSLWLMVSFTVKMERDMTQSARQLLKVLMSLHKKYEESLK